MSTSMQEHCENLSLGARIELLEIDISSVVDGAPVYRYTPNVRPDGSFVQFNGFTFVPAAIKTDGFLLDGSGGHSRPTIEVADVSGVLMLESLKYHDMVGVVVRRWVTAEQFLNNPNAGYGPEVWIISRKVHSDGRTIRWEMASYMDQRGLKFPRRQMFRSAFPALARTRTR